jgi:anti-anti-sigma factor
MVSEFSLKFTEKEGCVVIATSGYINNLGGQQIIDGFNKYFKNGIKNFIINLDESKVVNSIGISFLIEIIEILHDSNGKLVFTNLDPAVDKTFMIMGLFQYAEKASDVDEGLKYFSAD